EAVVEQVVGGGEMVAVEVDGEIGRHEAAGKAAVPGAVEGGSGLRLGLGRRGWCRTRGWDAAFTGRGRRFRLGLCELHNGRHCAERLHRRDYLGPERPLFSAEVAHRAWRRLPWGAGG